MRNFEKLQETFPHIASSFIKICPAMLYGYTVCPFRGEITENNIDSKDLHKVYNINDSKCTLCAKMFWKSEYDGAENIEIQKINTTRLREKTE